MCRMKNDRLTGSKCRPIRSKAGFGGGVPFRGFPFSCGIFLGLSFLLASCSGVQSTLDPAGPEARDIATLFFTMLVGAVLIWVTVVGALIYAGRLKREALSEAAAGRVILWCGAILPVLILAALLSYAVWLMPNIRPWFQGEDGGMRRIEVTGEQFWWRVRYFGSDGELAFETANEVRMPVGEPVVFEVKSPDVIHSFWIPALGGKMDMIPGRTNRLMLEASRPGTYRGVCAEFCGPSHALMAFSVLVLEPAEYDTWLSARTAASANTGGDGLALFLRHGCAACHAISGTEARGTIGPDLTAFGERATVGAGTLSNTQEHIARFIRYPTEIKPQARMPSFGMLPEDDVERIAAYLKELR